MDWLRGAYIDGMVIEEDKKKKNTRFKCAFDVRTPVCTRMYY
jgi:hypothetical protein